MSPVWGHRKVYRKVWVKSFEQREHLSQRCRVSQRWTFILGKKRSTAFLCRISDGKWLFVCLTLTLSNFLEIFPPHTHTHTILEDIQLCYIQTVSVWSTLTWMRKIESPARFSLSRDSLGKKRKMLMLTRYSLGLRFHIDIYWPSFPIINTAESWDFIWSGTGRTRLEASVSPKNPVGYFNWNFICIEISTADILMKQIYRNPDVDLFPCAILHCMFTRSFDESKVT